MNTARNYAQALFALIEEHPDQGSTYLRNLERALARRGHERLLPRIFAEYRLLQERAERIAAQRAESPQERQRRNLVELYRTLIETA